MRIHLGDLPATSTDTLESEGWKRVSGPNSRAANALAWLLGVFLLFALISPMVLWSFAHETYTVSSPAPNQKAPWFAIVLTLLLSIPAHEFTHAVFLPDFGLSQSTILALWPRKLRFGIFFEGQLSKSRWLVMRSAPYIILALLPALWLMFTMEPPGNYVIETCMTILITVNSLGSGGDLLAAQWVLFHLPKGSTLMFMGGRAYWKVVQ